MKEETVLKFAITPHFKIEIDKEDGKEPLVWRLCYTYKAIAKIEDAIKKDIKRIEDWKELSSGKDFPVIVWGGLDKFNPEVTLDQVKEMLNPEAQRMLSDVIFDLCFPGAKEAYEKSIKESSEKAGATADPNSPAVNTTA